MKDAGLRIRVQRGLRDEFVTVCREQDKSAAQVLREFMREYVDRHTQRSTNKEEPRRKDKR
ncbi:MAG: plasmid-related protein [Candidatus Thiodiazotropha sp.]